MNEYWLEPSSMVAVRTTERVVLPSHVTGLATLVTSLTHDGLLCLNVGVIDPGYDGHISAFLVNFSSRPRKIALNKRLLRVLFFTHNTVQNLNAWENKKATYQTFLENKASKEFSSTFLDSAGLAELARKSAWKVVLDAFFSRYLNVFCAAIAVLSIAIAYFSMGQ
ncbi:MAG: dCTP deaminase domain-containing protein [Paracoccaceae bacterium]